MATDKEFDIAVCGATGFTGKLIAEYLFGRYGDSIKLAIAGRNESKLMAVIHDLQASGKVATVVVDVADEAGLLDLAKRTKVIITAIGPYGVVTAYARNSPKSALMQVNLFEFTVVSASLFVQLAR